MTIIRPYGEYRLSNGHPVKLPSNKPLERIVEAVNSIPILTNLETLGISAGMSLGFRDNAGYLVLAIFFCDSMKLGSIALGSVMEQMFLGSGHRFIDVIDPKRTALSALQYRVKLFEKIGVDVVYPTAASSEVITHMICNKSELRELIIPCPSTSYDGEPCGVCFKCFRKFGMDGQLIDNPDPSTIYVISKIPVKSATSTVYSCHKSGFINSIIARYSELDLSWLERYYDDGYDFLLPDGLREEVFDRYAELGFEPMNDDDKKKLKEIGEIFNNPGYNA